MADGSAKPAGSRKSRRGTRSSIPSSTEDREDCFSQPATEVFYREETGDSELLVGGGDG